MKVFYNNEWLKVLVTIHTHPNVLESTGLLMHSSSDMTTHQKLKTFSIVLAKDRNAVYGYYPQGDAVGTITTLGSLLSGKFSIIRNYRYIISEIKKQIKK